MFGYPPTPPPPPPQDPQKFAHPVGVLDSNRPPPLGSPSSRVSQSCRSTQGCLVWQQVWPWWHNLQKNSHELHFCAPLVGTKLTGAQNFCTANLFSWHMRRFLGPDPLKHI